MGAVSVYELLILKHDEVEASKTTASAGVATPSFKGDHHRDHHTLRTIEGSLDYRWATSFSAVDTQR